MQMRSWMLGLLAATALVATPVTTLASSLQVMPVNVEVPAPGAVSSVTITNTGTDLVNAQVRIFKWVQTAGQDELIPTRDVIASPPAIKLLPGKKNVIRVVRLSKTPAQGEETYRLLVDEVPKAPKAGEAGVAFSVRYSIPVFFTTSAGKPELAWKASVSGGKLVLQARNDADHRARLAALMVASTGGRTIHVSDGLAGYVLGQSSRKWIVKGKPLPVGATIKITAQSDNGPIEATVRVVAAD